MGCSDADSQKENVSEWNVVLITLDTVRADALGAYGQALPVTPALDRMAKEGVLFEHAVSAAPHTLASHASILTGLYPTAHGVRGNHGFRLAPEQLTWAEILRAQGHRTRAEIAATVLRPGTSITQGFEASASAIANRPDIDPDPTMPDESIAETSSSEGLRRSAENISQRGIEFITAHRDESFFLWLHYFDAHLPYRSRPADRKRFPDAPYLAQITALDREVERVLQTIRDTGLRERTLVIVTSDHGEGLGEHDEPTHSYFLYDSTIRVPLLFWGPRALPQGQRILDLVRTVDILPTVLDWMEVETPQGLDGVSLRPLMLGRSVDGDWTAPPAYGESFDLYRIFGTTPLRFVREGPWKYIHSATPELFHVASDPGEIRNRIADQPEIAARLRARLEALLAKASPASSAGEAGMSAETRAQLLALGYLAPDSDLDLADGPASLVPMGPAPAPLAQDAERLSRAKGSMAAKRWDRALAILAPVRAAHPESPSVLAMVAEALTGQGSEKAALTMFREALLRSADACNDFALEYSRALHKFGHEAKRIAVLEETWSKCTESSVYRNELAWALATTPDPSLRKGRRAVELAEPLVGGENGGQPDPNALDTLAAAYATNGEYRRAAKTQEHAIKILRAAGASSRLIMTYSKTAKNYHHLATSD